MAEQLDPTKFRVSSALKTIIGKELITDDFIAVFELVKNSFDAHATRVDITFENLMSEDAQLIIRDDGKGMDLTDLVEKWLFVAYSAKKDGTEDYRDKIKSRRIQAGAKGIGRFSCDKLGSRLTVYTKKRGRGAEINKLFVDWNAFEKDPKKEFMRVGVEHEYVGEVPHASLEHGTILEIRKLRERWDRKKLLKLRHSLEKLINPSQENDPSGFAIFLKVPEEELEDVDGVESGNLREVVNGKVENLLFEDLENKTTRIEAVVSEDGKTISTVLEDRGTRIYDAEETNPYAEKLRNIRVVLFVLNKSAKTHFTKAMGIPSVQYGSIYLFKNGFRIYPFGEEGEDSFGLDRRKAQGQARYLGTRDLIGRIEINGPNADFQETSSRDGGLIKNRAFENLKEFVFEFAVKRLEKFVVDVIKWGQEGDILHNPRSSQEEMQTAAFEIIERLTASDRIINLEYDPKVLNILRVRSEKSVGAVLHNLTMLAEKTGADLIAKEVRRAHRQYKSLVKAKEEAEAETRKAEEKAEEAQQEADQRASENLFLKSVLSEDRKDILSFHHHIGIASDTIEDYVKSLARKIRTGKGTDEVVSATLEKISYQAKIISSISRFATRANFVLKATEIRADVVGFIREHLLNVWSDVLQYSGSNLRTKFSQAPGEEYDCYFKPIEICVIIDNLVSNSKKANASLIDVHVEKVADGMLEITFKDDGIGIPAKNLDRIFDLGFTTTNGSGLGLFHVKQTVKRMGGTIKCNAEVEKGVEFIIRLKGSK